MGKHGYECCFHRWNRESYISFRWISVIKAYWIEKDTFETSNKILVGNPDVSYSYEIIGRPKLKYGFKRKFSLRIMDNAGNEADNAVFTWNVVSDFQVEQDIDGKKITLCVNDESAVDSAFMLQVVIDGAVQNELEILVRGEI